MQSPATKLRPCRKCGALNGSGFDRCVRCNASLAALASGGEALKSSLGASVDATKLWGTFLLIGLTGLVFMAQASAGLRAGSLATLRSGGSGAEIHRFGGLIISLSDAQDAPYRLLSAVFVHFGVLHFLMNMMGLWSTGRIVEPATGSARFVFAYLACGFLGFATDIGFVAVFPAEAGALTAGASGAVFGTMGMTLGWLIRIRDSRWRSFAVQTVFYAVVVNLVVTVNNGAHIGGLLSGVAFGFYFASRPRPRTFVVANIGALLALILAIASLVLSQLAWSRRPQAALAEPTKPRGACASVPPPRPFEPPRTPIDSSSTNVV